MKRWAACPGSVKLSEGIESSSSDFADEGTAAHALGEAMLSGAPVGSHIEVNGKQYAVDDMLEHVKVYHEAVMDVADRHGASLLVERRFHLKQLHPDLFGTADAIVWRPDTHTLHVFDLKYGAGVPVEVKNNPQLMYYALGALLETRYPAKVVEMTIVQPRCPHEDGPVRTKAIKAVDLIDWTADLMDAVHAVEEAAVTYMVDKGRAWQDAFLNHGEHCRFCPAAALCPVLKETAQTAAKSVFAADLPYDPKELAATLDQLDIIEAWVKNVREFAYAEAEKGRAIPSYKLVEKRATRKWRDEAEASLAMAAFISEDEMFTRKIITPAAMEKLLPKDKRDVLDDLCIKESSGHTLVHESDKRPAVSLDAKSAFSNS